MDFLYFKDSYIEGLGTNSLKEEHFSVSTDFSTLRIASLIDIQVVALPSLQHCLMNSLEFPR
jgi:hypothetical protein